MDFFSALRVSSGALTSQRMRINVISSNIANAQTTRTAEGGPYKRKDIIFEPDVVKKNAFQTELDKGMSTVKVTGIEEDQAPARMVYDPKHPDADENGYVAFPNVNVIEEMVNLINASRSYSVSTQSIKSIKEMANQALSIGQG